MRVPESLLLVMGRLANIIRQGRRATVTLTFSGKGAVEMTVHELPGGKDGQDSPVGPD